MITSCYFVLSTQLTFCCYCASLACMTELVAVETSQMIRETHVHFHLKIAYVYCCRQLKTIKRQEQCSLVYFHHHSSPSPGEHQLLSDLSVHLLFRSQSSLSIIYTGSPFGRSSASCGQKTVQINTYDSL